MVGFEETLVPVFCLPAPSLPPPPPLAVSPALAAEHLQPHTVPMPPPATQVAKVLIIPS